MIQITADTRRAVVTNKELLTVGSAGIQVEFTISEDWDGLAKLAVFRVGDEGTKVDVVLGESLTCVVPPEVLTVEGEPLFIGIYGANEQGTVIIPTVWASAGVVKPGTEPNTPANAQPTPEIWAQILGVATDAEQTAAAAMSNVEAGLQELSALENTVQNAEDQRQANEQVRIANEAERVAAETERSSAENSREVAETERLGNETTRQNNEAARATAETARASAETERASAEQTRKVNENTRNINENTRRSSETMRTRQETLRQEHEVSRMNAETARNGAENMRTWNSEHFLSNGVSATTLPAGSDATVTTTWITNPSTGGTGTVGSIAFGIPQGKPGSTDAGDIEFDDSVTYAAGSIGAEVSQQKNAISQNEEAVADTQSMIATVEATTTASKNYSVGDLLVYDGKLYKVTSAIATGATIIVGSNVTQTTVETQIASSSGGGSDWTSAEVTVSEEVTSVLFDVPLTAKEVYLEYEILRTTTTATFIWVGSDFGDNNTAVNRIQAPADNVYCFGACNISIGYNFISSYCVNGAKTVVPTGYSSSTNGQFWESSGAKINFTRTGKIGVGLSTGIAAGSKISLRYR